MGPGLKRSQFGVHLAAGWGISPVLADRTWGSDPLRGRWNENPRRKQETAVGRHVQKGGQKGGIPRSVKACGIPGLKEANTYSAAGCRIMPNILGPDYEGLNRRGEYRDRTKIF